MNNCKGILGYLFGHKFISKIVEYKAPMDPGEISGDVKGIMDKMADKKYKIICKRCGVEK